MTEAKYYFNVNGLNVNENKTQCIFIGSRQLIAKIPPDFRFFFGQTPIIPSKSVKNLGVHFDQFMLFDVHINEITRKVNGILIFLNRFKNRLDKATRLTLVQSLAFSKLNYCCKIWGMTTKQQLERVQKVQNFAARLVEGQARKFDHVTPIIRELKWLKIENKIGYDISCLLYKIKNNQLPDWLFRFPAIFEVQQRSTRQSNNLLIHRTNTDIGARAISIKGPRTWNEIPADIKFSPSFEVFKKKLKDYLINVQQ